MPEKYVNFAALAASVPRAAYAITARDLGTPIVVVAPHGGGIEPGTSEIALSIAADRYSHYLFEGRKKRSNHDLHITSVNFDEPSSLSLLRSAQMVVTIHGEDSGAEVVYVGGRHAAAVAAIRAALTSAGFKAHQHPSAALSGRDVRNICNIGACGAGVQLELSRGLRSSFFKSLSAIGRKSPTPRLSHFGTVVREVLGKSEL